MRHATRVFLAGVVVLVAFCALGASLETPEKFLGFKPGADYKLAGWTQIEQYFRRSAQASDRVRIEDIGRSTEGRPMIVAVISSPANLKRIAEIRRQQQQIADSRLLPDEQARCQLAAAAKIVVLVNCGLHSSECMSTHTAMELLYELAVGDSSRINEILEQAVVLLVPSANPDGTDLVANWYQRTVGKPWEGDGMPWLYHKYCGHDNNRDWFALNLQETRNLSRVLYQEWFPTIVVDLHQQSSHSVRIALPPYYSPISPNIPRLVSQAQLILGGHMATELTREGKSGVAFSVNYDLWYHGAFRSGPNRHNMIGILTETASARLATPLFIPKKDLKGTSRGLPEYAPAVNFSEPWPGGWWRPADILEYQRVSTFALLAAAARHHDLFQTNHGKMAEQAVATGHHEPPYAWLVPDDQPDYGAAVRMLRSLHGTGIEVHRVETPFSANGVAYPQGAWLMFCAQPFRPHLMDMMERQRYPERAGVDGKPETPYDIAGWTLPLQMGVRSVAVSEPLAVPARKLDTINDPQPRISGPRRPAGCLIFPTANDDYRLVNRLCRKGIELLVLDRADESLGAPAGSFVVPSNVDQMALLGGLGVKGKGLAVRDLADAKAVARPLNAPRVAVYQPWLPCMDEGWIRLLLEQYEFAYTSLHNVELRAGQLRERFDCIVLPSLTVSQILEGQARDATEPQYAGGIGEEGVLRLQEFVEAGGTLVCIDDSCPLPIKYFALPVRDALVDRRTGKRLDREQFFCPGSVLAVTLDSSHPVAWGRPGRLSAYFVDSMAFEVETSGKDEGQHPARRLPVKVVARYADTLILESGYLRGEQHLAGKAAVVQVTLGKGQVVLFGFRVQHRCQTHSTYRLLFNAIQSSTL